MSKSNLLSYYKQLVISLENDELSERHISILNESMEKLLTNPFKYEHCYLAAAAGDIEELKKMHQAGFELTTMVEHANDHYEYFSTTAAAENGHLECLKYAFENDCEWDELTTSRAALGGHIDCLKYAHENGCDWDESTTSKAAENGHLDCLRYARENGCPWDEWTPAKAALNGHLDCLRYARKNGCAWDVGTTNDAARNGHFNCLRFAHKNGCEWGKYTAFVAAWGGHLDCLRYLIENGCPYDTKNKYIVEKVKQVTKDIQISKNIIKTSLKNKVNDNVINEIVKKYV